MRKLAILLVLAFSSGCIAYGDLVPGHKKDQYFLTTTTNFLFFRNLRIFEFKQLESGEFQPVRVVVSGRGSFVHASERGAPPPRQGPPPQGGTPARKESDGQDGWWGK